MNRLLLISFVMAMVLSCSEKETDFSKVKIVAHRGGATLGPENTLSCLEAGIQAGADILEIDVHLSADGAVVVCHDESINRTTTGEGRIEDLTLAQIKAASIQGHPDEHIPTLQEVLSLVKGRCFLLIEIKRSRDGQYPQIEEKILSLLNEYEMGNQVAIQSFNDSVLKRFHQIAPSITLEKLLVCPLPFGLALVNTGLSRFSLDDYPYVSSFNLYNGCLTPRFIRTVHERGKSVKAWTVNDPSDVIKGVDAVITDAPQNFR